MAKLSMNPMGFRRFPKLKERIRAAKQAGNKKRVRKLKGKLGKKNRKQISNYNKLMRTPGGAAMLQEKFNNDKINKDLALNRYSDEQAKRRGCYE